MATIPDSLPFYPSFENMARSTINNSVERPGRYIRWGLTALLAGTATGIGWMAIESSSRPVSVANAPPLLESSTVLPPLDLPRSQEPSVLEPALSSTADSKTVGTAESYNAAGVLVMQTGVHISKTQAEQGLDDGSGLTYPCVFIGDPAVCQRKLTATEAASEQE